MYAKYGASLVKMMPPLHDRGPRFCMSFVAFSRKAGQEPSDENKAKAITGTVNMVYHAHPCHYTCAPDFCMHFICTFMYY